MSETNPPRDDPAQPLSEAAVASARQIAEWCERQRAAAETAAKGQIRVVWMLLLGGLILLLILPTIIQWIDFSADKTSLPPEVLKTAQVTTGTVTNNRDQMKKELDAAAELVTEIEERIAAQDAAIASAATAIEIRLRQPFAVWMEQGPQDLGSLYSIYDIELMPSGELVAVGEIRGDKASRPLFLRSLDGKTWVRPTVDDGPAGSVQGALTAVAFDTNGSYVATLASGGRPQIITSTDGSSWREDRIDPASPLSMETGRGALSDLAQAQDGALIAVGSSRTSSSIDQVMLRRVGGVWWAPGEQNRFSQVPGSLRVIKSAPAWGLLVGGIDQSAEFEDDVVVYASGNGMDWAKHVISLDGVPIRGALIDLSIDLEGKILVLADRSEPSVLLSDDARNWQVVSFTRSGLVGKLSFNAVEAGPSGGFLIAGTETDRRGRALVLFFGGGDEMWNSIRLERGGEAVDRSVLAMATTQDGRQVLGGEGTLLVSLTEEETGNLVDEVLRSTQVPRNLVVEEGIADDLFQYDAIHESRDAATNRLTELKKVEKTAQDKYDRQVTAVREIGDLTTELEKSLRANEPFRQIAQTATRLAVIGLLIYLVQIVVNRYRYLQRLAGFYQARAQALMMFAASPEADLLKGVSLADLTTMLSPDAIGFDKSAEPPTSQMVSLLQAGLRKA